MSTHVVPPHVAMPNADVANLSIQDLQHQLKECWVRYEKSVKQEMAPLLYQLRTKLKMQGNHKGEGFAQWVKANLGLSLSTVNRWASEYAVEQGLKKRTKARGADGATSGHLTGSRREPESFPDGQYPVNFIFTEWQRKEFCRAQEILGDERSQQVMFNAMVKAAARELKPEIDQVATVVHPTKKAPARAARATSTKRKVSIQ